MPGSFCPLCHKRKAGRFCPALGQTICAVCCGTEREMTLDCPSHCAYLVTAHRYETQHRRPEAPAEIPFRQVSISPDLVQEFTPVVAGLAYATLRVADADAGTTDNDALAGLQALAETYRTLLSGLYYERAPAGGPAQAVYRSLAKFLQDLKQRQATDPAAARLKDSQLFQLLVFLFRVGLQQTNGRRRSRKFLGFLRAQFPAAAQPPVEPSRIILP
jgi:hypothetical protein